MQDGESSKESYEEKEENYIPRKGEREILRGSKMQSAMKTILDLYQVPEPEYPKIGEPLGAHSVRSKTNVETLYQAHVIVDYGNGIFLELGFDSESKALEYSANFVWESRTKQRSLGKI